MNSEYINNGLNIMKEWGMSSKGIDYVSECLESGTQPEINGKDGQVYQKFKMIMGKA
jgi:hypothetical protein